ncbi:MAG: LacI family transcriptional regulator [Lachnospiraceae bacterium]|jgi:LacI family transcriptional regulator|nr:LacI family transcriptional regulator [Lachnospiraceae bacterium]
MNISDVAKYAGVSKTTVSRVLMNSGLVKVETRDKVLKAIREMNYVPNTSAQMLAKKHNKIIGVICGYDVSDPFFGAMNNYIFDACRKCGYLALFASSNGESDGCDDEIAMLYGKVDGYILCGQKNNLPKNVEKIIDMKMPVALFKIKYVKKGAISVDIDNRKGGELAAEYLYGKGYRKIGYMGSVQSGFQESCERHDGFAEALSQHGLKIKMYFEAKRDNRTAYKFADKVIKSGVDAVFCDTDMMAYGLVYALQKKGISIPKDIAVLGFDDVHFLNFEPAVLLSTVSQPMQKMASCIVKAIIGKIEDDIPYGESQVFDCRIVERETT